MTESDLERRVCRLVKIRGGRAFKFVSPGTPGVPDRICVFPGGKVIFVELKRPGRKDGLSPQQKKIISWLQSKGCEAWVINDYEQFQRRIDEILPVRISDLY